jgi:hypothetical protein
MGYTKSKYERHISSQIHIKALEYQNSRSQNRQNITEQQRNHHSTASTFMQSFSVGNSTSTGLNLPSETAEQYMWDSLHPSKFGDPGQYGDPEEAEMRRVEKDMDIFGLYNSVGIGRELSGSIFEEPEAQGENPEDDDDAVLASILQNIGVYSHLHLFNDSKLIKQPGFEEVEDATIQNKPTDSQAEWFPYESKTVSYDR